MKKDDFVGSVLNQKKEQITNRTHKTKSADFLKALCSYFCRKGDLLSRSCCVFLLSWQSGGKVQRNQNG